MDSSSTDKLDVELNDEGWIDVYEEQDVNTDSNIRKSVSFEKGKTDNEKQTVVILDDDNDRFYLSTKTSDKSTSTISLDTNVKIPDKTSSLKFWDKWLKVFVLTGAVISVVALGVVLFEEQTKKVMKS